MGLRLRLIVVIGFGFGVGAGARGVVRVGMDDVCWWSIVISGYSDDIGRSGMIVGCMIRMV